MGYDDTSQQAIQARDQLASLTESMGLQLTRLPSGLFPAFAIAFGDEEVSICSTLPGVPNLVLFSSGVIHGAALSPGVYSAVNTANRELGFGRYAVATNTDEPELASVFYQLGAFTHLVMDPDYLRFCLTHAAKSGVEGRPTLAKEGVIGTPYGWNDEDINRLWLQHAV